MAIEVPRPYADYPKELFESANSLSDASIMAALNRAESLGFVEGATLQISVQETTANLSHSRDVLLDLVRRGRMVQIPLKIQARLLQETNKVATTLAGLTNGNDLVQALEASVEDLNASIWQFGLQNQSESVLGFERKMNELKAQGVEVNRSLTRARKVNKRLDDVEQLMEELGELHKIAGRQSGEVASVLQGVQEKDEKATEVADEIQATFALVKQYETAIAAASATTRDAAAEAKVSAASADAAAEAVAEAKTDYEELVANAKALMAEIEGDAETLAEGLKSTAKAARDDAEGRVDTLIEQVEEAEVEREGGLKKQLAENIAGFGIATTKFDREYREKYQAFEADSRNTLNEHNASVDEIVDRLKAIEQQIDGAILKATGFTLFHSFQKRQEELHLSTRFWAKCLAASASGSAVAALAFLFLLPYFPSSTTAIYFKASLALPFLAAFTFCGWQYTRERRLEEEYAFKSNISISLKPYQQLVDELVDKNNPEERAKYTAFIISSINKVFTSPTGLVFDDKEIMPSDEAKALLKEALAGAKEVVKASSSK